MPVTFNSTNGITDYVNPNWSYRYATSNTFCFLRGVYGKFAAASDYVKVYPNADGYWHIAGSGSTSEGITPYVECTTGRGTHFPSAIPRFLPGIIRA